jgi:hypothetical protein
MWHYLEKETHINNDDGNETNNSEEPTAGTGASDGIDFAFEGLFDHSDNDGDMVTLSRRNINKESIQIRCKNQHHGMKMRDNEGNFKMMS